MPTDYKNNTDTLELSIINGDFSVFDSTEQHQRLLLIATAGEYKQKPLAGVGLPNYLLEERPGNLLNNIRSQFVKDGMQVNALSITEQGTILIDAPYNV